MHFTASAQTKLFTVLPGKAESVSQSTLLQLQPDQLRSILDKKPEKLELQLPFEGQVIAVQLEKSNPFHEGFHLDTDRKSGEKFMPGVYYSGKNGSFNFFEGELNGIVSVPGLGNLVVGPYRGNYVIYNDASLGILNDFECKFEDPKPSDLSPIQPLGKAAAAVKCATVYLEVDYALYTAKGSLTNTTNYITSLFNNVQTLFANSGIPISLKSMYVWTSADPYTGTTSTDQLNYFNQYRPTFDGDLGQLVAADSGSKGGIAAAVMGLCSQNNFSYVDIDTAFLTVPTYSWSVQGMTHELGHLLGSPHTHACAWNGNNTPIDSCGIQLGYTEGSCSSTLPVSGTIMSYCHLVSGVGINFANGFGTQPSARILSNMAASVCLGTDCVTTCINGTASVTLTTQTTTSLAFNWTDQGDATSWQVGVFTMGGIGTYSTVTSSAFTKTGLTANTFYKIRIRPVCSSGMSIPYREFVVPTAADWCAGVTITDSGGSASSYTVNEDYIRTITPSAGKKAKITFTAFNLESAKDYLYVYNGTGTGTLLGSYTGTTVPAAITSTAADGTLTLRFKSNKSVNSTGFVASVSCTAASSEITCTTSTTWNGSAWSNGTPSSSKSAIINGNYTSGTSFTCCNLIINSGKTLTIGANTYVQVQNNVTNSGTLLVKDKGQLIQVSNNGVNTGNGTFSRTTPSIAANVYVYWSSPTTNTTLGTGVYGWYNHATFNPANFADTQTIVNGTVTASVADGMDDNNDCWVAQSTTTVMAKGVGYIARNPSTGIKTKDFVGVPTNGIVTVPLVSTPSTTTPDYNLVGNPYPSAINANTVISTNTGTTGVLYFWTHKSAPVGTAPGGVPGNYAGIGDFSAYSLAGGIASESGSAAPTNVIPSHQGFFVVKTSATNFTFNNAMRSATLANTGFMRQAAQDRFWLSLSDSGNLFRQTLVSYIPETTTDNDWGYDAEMVAPRADADLYTLSEAGRYWIQARGDFQEADEVFLGFTADKAGTYTISLDTKEGQLDQIFLKDAYTGKALELTEAYTFTSDAGSFEDRFSIVYRQPESMTDAVEAEQAPIHVYPNPTSGILHVSAAFGKYELYDLSGKRLGQGGSGDIDLSAFPPGIYLLRIDGQKAIKVVRS